MTEIRTSFRNIYLATDSYIFAKGEVRLGQSGLGWKPDSENDAQIAKSLGLTSVSAESGLLAIQTAEISRILWQRVARGYGIRITMKSGTFHKLDGFERDNFDELKTSVAKYFHGLQLEVRDTSVKGHNWGKADFEGTSLVFKVENKPMFDIPLETVSNTNLAGKSEVSIEIQPAKSIPSFKRKAMADELVEVRFYVPGTVSKETDPKSKPGDNSDVERDDDGGEVGGEQEISAAQVFYETVKSKADLGQITGKSIVTFNEILCLTPRGRYTIDMFKQFLRLRGKTYDYKILYEHISKLFMVTKPDGMHVLFIIHLVPPIRQGQTRYPYLVFQLLKDEEKEIVLNLSKADLSENVISKLQKRYDEPLYKTVTELFTVLTGKHLGIPDTYSTVHGSNGAKCSLKANEGLLYPLAHGLLFVPKPTQFFPYSEISSIVFSRVGSVSATSARTFDLIVHTHNSQDTQFSSISREEYNNLFEYMRENGVKVISDSGEKAGGHSAEYSLSDDEDDEDDDDGTASRRRSTKASGGGAGDEDDEDEEEDEDFVAQSESDLGEEYDENYESEPEANSD